VERIIAYVCPKCGMFHTKDDRSLEEVFSNIIYVSRNPENYNDADEEYEDRFDYVICNSCNNKFTKRVFETDAYVDEFKVVLEYDSQERYATVYVRETGIYWRKSNYRRRKLSKFIKEWMEFELPIVQVKDVIFTNNA